MNNNEERFHNLLHWYCQAKQVGSRTYVRLVDLHNDLMDRKIGLRDFEDKFDEIIKRGGVK